MFTCPICGFDKLEKPLWDEMEGFPTHFICCCCGFESGFDDDDRGLTIEEYREEWIEDGAKWFSTKPKQPDNWKLKKQLKNINVDI